MINGTFLLLPTKGKTKEEIQSRLTDLKKMTNDDNIFYAVFADSKKEDDYNNMMVLYAMKCKNIIISKDYQDDMMCRSPESMSIAMLSPIRIIIFPSESIAMLSETVNAKSPSSKSKKCFPISEFLQNVLEHFKCGILLCFFL